MSRALGTCCLMPLYCRMSGVDASLMGRVHRWGGREFDAESRRRGERRGEKRGGERESRLPRVERRASGDSGGKQQWQAEASPTYGAGIRKRTRAQGGDAPEVDGEGYAVRGRDMR